MRTARLGVLSAILVLASSATAHATFPGKDGPISYNRFDTATNGASLFSVKQRGHDERQLTHFAPGTVAQFSDWSPDGRLLAFDSDQAGNGPVTYVMKADGSHIRQLTDTSFSADPGWAPNGRRIAIEADWGDYPAAEGIWTFPFRKSGLIGSARRRSRRSSSSVPTAPTCIS